MAKKKKAGRPRLGQPISVTVTDEQKAWIDDRIPPGGTRTQVVRALIQLLMDDVLVQPCATNHCYKRKGR